MNEEKSAIDSFSVSMGPSSKAAQIPRAHQGEPWNILVFSDLGFKTASPLRITIAEWNDIMKSGNIVLAGAVKGAPDEKSAPLYIEHGVSSMKDFSAESLKNNAAFIGFSRVLETLTRLMEGTTSMDEARRSIKQSGQQHAAEDGDKQIHRGGPVSYLLVKKRAGSTTFSPLQPAR